MDLESLFANIPHKKSQKFLKSFFIKGLCSHSKKVQKGDLFIDWKGCLEHALEARSRQALGIVSKSFYKIDDIPLICLDNFDKDVISLIQKFYDYPQKKLSMIGITGTCGKTTTSYLTYHVLNALKNNVGLISTVQTLTGKQSFLSSLTTTDVVSCYNLLSEMVESQKTVCVMEVSSHGIDQKRVEGIDYDVAVFTNLSHEHLDYHKTFEHYANTKKKLFYNLKDHSLAVINLDDKQALKMVEGSRANVVTYGIEKKADYTAKNIQNSPDGTVFELFFQNQVYRVKTRLCGYFNVYNILASIAVVHKKGFCLNDIVKVLESFDKAPGRLEKISTDRPYSIYVDFAHKPEALENVLKTIKSFSEGRVITVLGCGGNRDKSKRPVMASIAEKYSDVLVFTSDNPRNEDPFEIIREMKKGLKKSVAQCVVDRREAIKSAIDIAKEKDVILIAGRGHESHQIIKGQKYPFRDADVVSQLLLEK